MPALAALSAMVSKIFRVDLVSGSTRSIRVSRISSAGTTKSVALRTSNRVQPGPASRCFITKASSASTRVPMKRSRRHEAAIGEEHVVEQHAGIRLVDIERALHRLGGEADLVAFDDAAFGELDVDPRLLDRIGVRDGDAGMIERDLADLLAWSFRPDAAARRRGGSRLWSVPCSVGSVRDRAKRGCGNMT